MDQIPYKDALDQLGRVGLSTLQIERLCRLRREHAGKVLEQTRAAYRRLEFVRWLVATGRLTG